MGVGDFTCDVAYAEVLHLWGDLARNKAQRHTQAIKAIPQKVSEGELVWSGRDPQPTCDSRMENGVYARKDKPC